MTMITQNYRMHDNKLFAYVRPEVLVNNILFSGYLVEKKKQLFCIPAIDVV